MRRHAPSGGFTLLEVMAALAIVAVGVAGLWRSLAQGITVAQALPERTVARMVAQNRLVLRQAREEWPPTQTYTGLEQMNGRAWHWEEQIVQTELGLMRQITVRVRAAAQGPVLFTLEGYLARPRPVAG